MKTVLQLHVGFTTTTSFSFFQPCSVDVASTTVGFFQFFWVSSLFDHDFFLFVLCLDVGLIFCSWFCVFMLLQAQAIVALGLGSGTACGCRVEVYAPLLPTPLACTAPGARQMTFNERI